MTPFAATDYDAVPYPSGLFAQTHPDRLATIGTLFGLKPAPVEHCRILELGCGDGTNLLAMAFALPQAQCLGIDLSGQAIARGLERIQELGLKNITLRHLDLMEAPLDLGEFDFILCHGLYSWVPEAVRNKIMEVCRRHLAAQGIAYISYNAYPGNHLRDLVRRMIRFHTAQFADPAEKVRQARVLIKFLAEAKPEPGLWQKLLHQQYERIVQYTEAGFYHDDLSSINHPVYFYEFAEHAARHELQYLAEADVTDLLDNEFPADVLAKLRETESGSVLAREQYLDFLKGRSFRQTLLCHGAVRIEREVRPERLFPMFVAGDTRPVQSGLDPASPDLEEFQTASKAVIATGFPMAKVALSVLGERWPERVPFKELLAHAQARLHGRTPLPLTEESQDDAAMRLGRFFAQSYHVGFVDLHVCPGTFVTQVSERPVASALARFLAQANGNVPTLRHVPLKLEDSVSRHLLLLLDGTNDRRTLFNRLRELIQSGRAEMKRDAQIVTDKNQAIALLQEQLEPCLKHLAQAGVLVA